MGQTGKSKNAANGNNHHTRKLVGLEGTVIYDVSSYT